jgi:hypothetical protein
VEREVSIARSRHGERIQLRRDETCDQAWDDHNAAIDAATAQAEADGWTSEAHDAFDAAVAEAVAELNAVNDELAAIGAPYGLLMA